MKHAMFDNSKGMGLFLVSALAALSAGCGGLPFQEKDEKSGGSSGGVSADLVRALDCGAKKKKAATASKLVSFQDEEAEGDEDEAAGGDTELETADPTARHIPAEDLFFYGFEATEDKRVSLCDTLRGKGDSLALVHVVSVKCFACLRWAQDLTAEIQAKNLDSRVRSVIVLSDPESNFQKLEVDNLVKDVAPSATWGFDRSRAIRPFFIDDLTKPIDPVLAVFDRFATGYLVRDVDMTLETILAQAEKILAVGIDSATSSGSTTTATASESGVATAPASATATSGGTATATGSEAAQGVALAL